MKRVSIGIPAVILLLNLLVLQSACSDNKKMLSRTEMIDYIQNISHGLSQTYNVGLTQIRINYQPSSLLLAQELQLEGIKDTAVITRLEKKYENHFYFLLKLSHGGKEAIRQVDDFSKYSELVQMLSFNMNRYVNLVTSNKDTIELTDYHFDQTYGYGNSNNVLLAFKKEKMQENGYLEVHLSECGFGVGALKFRFNSEDFKNIPPLDYNNL